MVIVAAGTPKVAARDRARPGACLPRGAATVVPIGGGDWFCSACTLESTPRGATLALFKLGNRLGTNSVAGVPGELSEAEGLDVGEDELDLDDGTSSRMAPRNVPTAPRSCSASASLMPPVSSQNLMFVIWRSQCLRVSQRGATKFTSENAVLDCARSTSATFSRIHGTARSSGV